MESAVRQAPERFAGFGEDALGFYEGLAADNSRAYWTDHKQVYDEQIAKPIRALAAELAEEFGPAKVFRPNRDLRFSPDKRPYKENTSMVVERDGAALYASLDVTGLMIAGGYYQPARDQLRRFRELQDDGRTTAALDRLLARLADQGYSWTGGALRTAPRGWSSDHLRIEVLRHTSLAVSHTWEPGDWLHTRDCLTRVAEGWRTVGTWNTWLHDHVGPSREPVRGR